MAQRVHYSPSTLAEAARGRTFPSWDVTRAFVLACHGDESAWAARWTSVKASVSGGIAESDSASAPTGGSSPALQQPAPSHRGWSSRLRPLLIVLAAVVAALVAGAGYMLALRRPPPAHSVFLGMADIERYCRARGYSAASLDGATAYDWHCTGVAGAKDSLSVIEACRWRYSHPTATARFDDIRNPHSWQCWDQVVILGRVDLNSYCRSMGYAKAAMKGPTVDLWRCVSTNHRELPIDPDSACRWQYGARLQVANIAHYKSPWEQWDCWG